MSEAHIALVVHLRMPPVAPDDPRVSALAARLRDATLDGVAVAISAVTLDALAKVAPDALVHLQTAAELLTTPATGAFFPLLDHDRPAMSAQLAAAARVHERHLGASPQGIWFDDGGYEPRTDDLVSAAGLRYAVVDADAVRCASAPAAYGVYAPISCPGSGLAVFARDPEARRLAGAPARPVAPDADATSAYEGAVAHAFAEARVAQARALRKRMDRSPLIVCALGLDELRPTLVAALRSADGLRLTTPGAWLGDGSGSIQRAWPGPSRAGGLVASMSEPERAWVLRHLHAASARLADVFAAGVDAASKLAARELVFAQSGEWLRGLAGGVDEARERLIDHLEAFNRVADDPAAFADPSSEASAWGAGRAAKWPLLDDLSPADFEVATPARVPKPPTDRAVDRHALPRPNEIW